LRGPPGAKDEVLLAAIVENLRKPASLVELQPAGALVRWAPAFQSLVELAEACDAPVRWACRTGVCQTCATGLTIGTVGYQPEPVEPPADGNAPICCCRSHGDIVIDLSLSQRLHRTGDKAYAYKHIQTSSSVEIDGQPVS
jgi:ferredoxin